MRRNPSDHQPQVPRYRNNVQTMRTLLPYLWPPDLELRLTGCRGDGSSSAPR